MTGKHYNWHKRWAVDLKAASATHDSGLVARFIALPLTEAQALEHGTDVAIGKCWTPDGCEWGVVTTQAAQGAVFDALTKNHGQYNAQKMLARIAREAGEVWVWQWHKSKDRHEQ